MGKTHEALLNAEKEYEARITRPRELPFEGLSSAPQRSSAGLAKEAFDCLKINFINGNAFGPLKRILFLSLSSKDLSYRYALRFAENISKDSKHRVLLIDFGLWTLSLREVLRANGAFDMLDLFENNEDTTSKIIKTGPGNLYRVRWGNNHAGRVKPFGSNRFSLFLREMSQRFDYLILNAPGVACFSDCRTLCTCVDRVVLVLNPGKSGRKVALLAREQLRDKRDHKLLGVAFDKGRAFNFRLPRIASWVLLICLVFASGLFFGNLSGLHELAESIAEPGRSKAVAKRFPVYPYQTYLGAHEASYGSPMLMGKDNRLETRQRATLINGRPAGLNDEPYMPSGGAVQTKNALPAYADKTALGSRPLAPARETLTVVAEAGDNLTSIIHRTYGVYNKGLLKAVLRENPQIQSLDRIYAGQSIRLPFPTEGVPENQ